jgi:hypothetical protein
MKVQLHLASILALLPVALGSLPAFAAAPAPVNVSGPTIVAFVPLVSEADIDALTEEAIVLDDFTHYLAAVRRCAIAHGVSAVLVEGSSFRVRLGRRSFNVEPSPSGGGFGYCFVRPGKKPRIIHGSRLPEDLAVEAARFFTLPSGFFPCEDR